MTATRQDKAECEATHMIHEARATHMIRKARKSTESAIDALYIACTHFVECGKPDQAMACRDTAHALEAQTAAIDDLHRQPTAEEEAA